MVPLKYLSSFCRTLEMSVINCEINLHPNLSKRCIIVATTAADQGATFSITDTKIYVPVLILSTQYNAKLLKQIKSAFKGQMEQILIKNIIRKIKPIIELFNWSSFFKE